ncbi:hypothetical protein HWV62_40979 [Athelia sp. TMB]|nr:hypothetical protein HWV62_40979 [Athelia sp. TMB]
MPTHINPANLLLISSFPLPVHSGSTADSDSDSDASDDSDGKAEVDTTPFPWGSQQWQRITGITANPFDSFPIAPSPFDWTTQADVDALNMFRLNFLALTGNEQVFYIRRNREDADKHGRILWLDWASKGLKTWKITTIVDGVLEKHNYHPAAIMRRLNAEKLPDMQSSQITNVYVHVGEALFGDDAFTADNVCLKPSVFRFVEILMVNSYRRLAKASSDQRNSLGPQKIAVDSWKEIIDMVENDPLGLTQKKLHGWLKQVTNMISLLKKFGDKKAVKLLQEQYRRIEEISGDLGAAITVNRTKLPKALKDALRHLATHTQIEALSEALQEQLVLANSTDLSTNIFDPELLSEQPTIAIEWKEC